VTGCAHGLLSDDDIGQDDRQKIQTETVSLREDLELATDQAARLVVDVETRLAQWMQFGKVSSGLIQWIEENETSRDVIDSSARDIAERLAKLEWLRMQRDELGRREQQAQQLEELVGKLTTVDDNRTDPDDMRKQLTDVRRALAEKREHIEVSDADGYGG